MHEYESLLMQYSSDYPTLRKRGSTIEEIQAGQGVRSVSKAEIPNAQTMDRAGFMGRVYSASYVTQGVSQRAKFDKALREQALREHFDKHAQNSHVAFLYRVCAICWQFSE